MASNNLGNVMYVGDSLTHGYTTSSYRYDLSKIYTDNGINYETIGVWSGNYNYTATLSYGGETFSNVHCAWSSMRAMQVVGDATTQEGNSYSNNIKDGTGIQQWLGVGNCSTDTATCTSTPDTMFVLLGTNDILSDSHNQESCVTDLKEDIAGIVSYAKEANSELNTYILTVPVWQKVVNSADVNSKDIEAVNAYNEQITEWAKDQENVTVIDINKGLIDVTKSATTAGQGVDSFFISDGLHFSNQGNLLVAGNIAKGMGMAGRTVGQERKASKDLAVQYNPSSYSLTNATATSTGITLQASDGNLSLASYTWATSPSAGFTVDFQVSLANKASADAWNTKDNLMVSVGDGYTYGSLYLNEAYIQWGGKILYSTDLTQLNDNIRIAYILGDPADSISAGYYVWLDDQLIGEALSGVAGSNYNGVTFSYSGTNPFTVSNISLDNTGSYAPASSGSQDNSSVFRAVAQQSTKVAAEGIKEWISVSDEARESVCINDSCNASSVTDLDSNGRTTYNVREQAGADDTKSLCVATISEGAASYIFANSGDYTGDVWVTINNEGTASAWYACQSTGTLTGDASIRFTEAATGGNTVFGAVAATKVDGDIYMEFSAAGANFTSWTTTNPSSVVGSHNTDINGDVTVVINAGTFANSVMAGIHTGTNNTITGSTNMYINGGEISGYVFGGGLTGTIEKDCNLTITGGTFNDLVIGGTKSTVNGNVNMKIAGGTFKSYVIGAFSNMSGDINLEISGGDFSQNKGIYAGSGTAGKTIEGSTTVTLKDIDANNSVASFTGVISGGNQATSTIKGSQSLVLDHYTADGVTAEIKDFDNISVKGFSDTSLNKLGGATKVSVLQASALTLDGSDSGMTDLTTVNVEKGSAVGLKSIDSLELLSSTLSGAVVLDNSTVSVKAGSQLDKATVVLGSGSKLVVADGAGTVTPVDPDTDTYTLPQSIVSLTGTGTLENNAQIELVSDNDTVFAGTLAGSGTLNLQGAGTQTFVGAGAEDMTVNVTEGGLNLVRGNADAIKLGSLNAAQGATVQVYAESNASEALTVKNGLDLSSASLALNLNGTIADYNSTSLITVESGDINLNNTVVSLNTNNADADNTDIGSDFSLTIVKHTGATTNSADTTAVRRGVRALASDVDADATVATAPNISAEGASVDVSDYYKFYFQNFALTTTDDSIVLSGKVKTSNSFADYANSRNSQAGSNFLWDTRTLAAEGTALGDAREAAREAIQAGNAAEGARIMSAVAGSTVNATGTAQRDAAQDQLLQIRNRTTTMGVRPGSSELNYNLWVEGTGAYSHQRTRGDQGGYKLSTWGGTVGTDFDVDQNLTLGAAFAANYGRLHSEAAERATGHLNSCYVDLFGRYQSAEWTHTLIVSASWDDAKLNRTIGYNSGSYATRGNTSGHGFSAMYEATYDIALNDQKTSILQPLFNASVVSTSMNSYTETGAGNANLRVGKQDWTTATLALGARWLGAFGVQSTGREWIGEARINVAQDLGNTQGKTSVNLAQFPGASQNVYGAKVGATALQLGFGLSTQIAPNSTVYANSDLDVRNNANAVSATIGYRYSF
jgi:lysophospholipase L1-like esterase